MLFNGLAAHLRRTRGASLVNCCRTHAQVRCRALRNATASALITRTDTPQSFGNALMLVPELTRQYDEAFQQFDVLVMPTMPFVATTLTAADAPIEEYVHSALNMLANTAPFDLTGHPATSVPAGLADGLPVAMMIVAPRFKDALALRVAQAYETARGTFPTPPGV